MKFTKNQKIRKIENLGKIEKTKIQKVGNL